MNGIANEEQRLKGNSIWNRVLAFFIKKAERLATKYSDQIISVTPQISSYLNQHFYCPNEKVEVVSNGVNIKKFYPIKEEALLSNLKKRLGLTRNEIVLAFVGNLAPWQGVEDLIRVAPEVVKKNKDIKFLIIGDGILKNEFEKEVHRLSLSDHFIFTGMVDYEKIPIYINIADICILLKKRLRSGYSPIKFYEYMACGKPIIASRVEGLEIIETEGLGLLIEPEDMKSLEEGIYELIKDPEKRKNMGDKGLRIAGEKFGWESRVAKIEKILMKLA
jgi:glycosyltransferase involved in cell wall biosynthesis